MKQRLPRLLLNFLLLPGVLACAQDVTLTARVAWSDADKQPSAQRSPRGVVLWLAPTETDPKTQTDKPSRLRLIQKNKSFEPHLLVVPVGSVVEFPNRDPFFHNVFSLFEGKRFDLGLYEAGSTRDVHFDKPGVSYIFCNIHPNMSAVVIAVPAPYHATSDAQGQVVIPNVPAGRYKLHLWYEGAAPEELEAMTREITVSERNSTLGVLRLKAVGLPQGHKNKYGRDYDPLPHGPGYEQP
jgi:plastocyanin